ncbi:hypothetical protein BD410DRAFT_782159 [Rickenella mellea]|uniref:Ceramide glucosyltransferase n=1 Tax=Rickenella mellea TaxID=50990 RepID=A0A4Y7QKK7_9AGAM|nr:hypothetical protein BD410DRAFT_782159 [Rickenella mellea]
MKVGDPRKENVLNVLAIIGVTWYSFLWVFSLVGCLTGRKRYRHRPRSPLSSAPPSNVPGVSILRPLKGLDANLYENLESTFLQEYPKFEILFSVAEENDQALTVVRDLLQKYPQVDAKFIIGEEVVGVNPKVNNLIRSYRQAAHDILWVLDSNVFATSGTLARSVGTLLSLPASSSSPTTTKLKRVGLIHHVPFAFISQQLIGARMEEAFLNTNHAKMYIALNTFAFDSCVVGKSNMYRRSDIEQLRSSRNSESENKTLEGPRGLAAFGRYLAEDNMIAAALWHELGLRHELSCDTACNTVGNMSFWTYVWRRVRWIRVRKHMVAAATLVEPFTECVALSLIAAWSLNRLVAIPPWLPLILHYVPWMLVDLDVYESLAGQSLPAERRLGFLKAWLVRELLALPVWVLAIVGNEVEWRGKSYQVMRNSEVQQTSTPKV